VHVKLQGEAKKNQVNFAIEDIKNNKIFAVEYECNFLKFFVVFSYFSSATFHFEKNGIKAHLF